MAIILSDTFNGMSASQDINGRTLDNGLGGSGTRSWALAVGISATNDGDGAGAVRRAAGATEQQGVSLGAATNGKARFKFQSSNLAVNFIVFGKADTAGLGTSSGAAAALLLANGTTNALRIRNQANTDLAQTSIAGLSTSTDYWLELEISGNDVAARILNSDLSVRNSVSYTYPSGAPSGAYWGFGTLSASNVDWRGDDFVMEDLGGAPVRRHIPMLSGGFERLNGGF